MGCNSSKQIYSIPKLEETELEMEARINFITRINEYDCLSDNENEPYYKYIEYCYSMYKLELMKINENK